MKIDEKDHSIIAALRDNARASVRDIARKTRIRPSTVHQRIQKLVENGIIEKFTLKLNNKAINENFIVFLFLTTNKDLSKAFFSHNSVREAFGITGEYDLVVKMKFKDVEAFNDYIIDLRKNPEIIKTLSMVVTATIKEEL